MNFSEYKRLIFSDLYRLEGCANFRKLLRHVILGDAYRYIFWMRTVRYLKGCKLYVKISFYSLARIMLRHVTYKLGISIPSDTEIGAKCVVTKDIPEHSVVVGIRGVVISDQGSVGYINRVDYDAVLLGGNEG